MTVGPLGGAGVLVTRPAHQAGDLVAAIEAAGGIAITFPVIRIEPRDSRAVAAELSALPEPDIVVFVSRNAVDSGLALHPPGKALLAAIGPATRTAIEQAGRRVDIAAGNGFDSERLLVVPELRGVAGRTVRIVRGDGGRELLAEELRRRGAQVHYLTVYHRLPVEHASAELERLDRRWRRGEIAAVIAMSVESFENLWAALPAQTRRRLQGTPLVSPSGRVIQTVSDTIPGSPAVLAAGPQAADLVQALIAAIAAGTRNE